MDEIQEVENLLKKIKKDKNLELYSALDLIYRCGIAQKEICTIKIRDVKKKKNCYLIDTHAKKKKRIVEIDGQAYNTLKKYLENTKQSLAANNDSFLFPKYNGTNGAKTMRRHCEEYPNRILPKEIRSAGIQSYNQKLSVTQTNKNKRQEIVAKKFRYAYTKSVKDKLNGKSKKARTKPLSKKQKNDLEMMRLFDQLGDSCHLSEIFDLCLEFDKHIEQCNPSNKDKNNLMKIWDDKAFQQISGKLIANQSKKDTGILDIIEIMEMIHKPYLLNEFDKELIEKKFKKMHDYFFPKVRHSFLPKKQTSFHPKDKNHFLPKGQTSFRPKSKNCFFSKKQISFHPKDKNHFLPKGQTSFRPKSKNRSSQRIKTVSFPTDKHRFLQRLILSSQRTDINLHQSLKTLIKNLLLQESVR